MKNCVLDVHLKNPGHLSKLRTVYSQKGRDQLAVNYTSPLSNFQNVWGDLLNCNWFESSGQKFESPIIAACTNNEINSEGNHETYTCFSAVVGGQHIVKLTTSPFSPKYYFRFISLVGYTLFPNLI